MAKKRDKSISDNLTVLEILRYFLSVHWRGVLITLAPLILSFLIFPLPAEPYYWVAYTLLLMAIFWVTECIPIAITGFFPVVIFPLTGISTTREICHLYMNDTIIMFLGSLFLASCVEQSGVHKRLVYFAVRVIGYSHYKLLLAICMVTTFISLWISNTGATTMMVPINFAVLKVFEEQKVLKIYETNIYGDLVASDLTTCYFCGATFSATIGGIGTVISTGTNLVFKGLYMLEYPESPDYLSFPLFSAFAIPYMIVLEMCLYLFLSIKFLGAFRPHSKEAERAGISSTAKEAAKNAVSRKSKALGSIRFHEIMSLLLFTAAMVLFFSRSPQIFVGWADLVNRVYGITDSKFIQDSAVCVLALFIMMSFPSRLDFFTHYTAKYVEDIPQKPLTHVLDWTQANKIIPYSYMFLLGGGFALSFAAKTSGLNDKIGKMMEVFIGLPLEVMILGMLICIIITTNFASNVAVANVYVPIAINLARRTGHNPLLLCIVAGFTCSFTFLMPVGTPGNLIVQSAAKIPTTKMIKTGLGPTITTIFVSWFAFYFWSPVIWPNIKN